MLYHVSNDGVARVCHATSPMNCPVSKDGDLKEHFKNVELAHQAYEKHMESRQTSKTGIKKSKEDKSMSLNVFSYTNPETVKQFKNKVSEIKPLFENYYHDYENYNPDERSGEREFIEKYDPKKYTDETTSYTADNIILRIDPKDDVLKVLMIKRGGHPFKNCWAHPGGFIDDIKDDNGNKIRSETRFEAASRELQEETGMIVEPEKMDAVNVYTHSKRDPRMEVHMNTHVVLMDEERKFEAADDAVEAQYIPITDIYNNKIEIAFDHKLSIKDALNFVNNS